MRKENVGNVLSLVGSVFFMLYLVGCAGFLMLKPMGNASVTQIWGVRVLVLISIIGAVVYGFIAYEQYKKIKNPY